MSDHNEGFMNIPRQDPGYRRRELRLGDWRAVERQFTATEIHDQSARCMDCGIPFCHGTGCPLCNLIPEFNELVYQQRWTEAWEILSATNPFPEFTGRICPAPCEGSCVAGLNGQAVAIRQIELYTVEHAFQTGLIKPQPPAVRKTERVAVVGSGPAGLAAAWQLNHKGYQVTVYENAPKPGGILRYGIPDFKLEKWVVERRIQLMRDEGIVFETGIEIGRDLSARYLRNRFDAVVLTGGARHPRDLPVPGRELAGVHFAMPYLIQQNRRVDSEVIPEAESITAEGKNVVVIGGGDTGSDCLGTALRQGALTVHQFEILPRPPATRSPSTPWPEWPLMLRESSSHKEGGERRWCISTKKLEGRDGQVVRLHGIEVEWVADASGRSAPREIPGTEFAVDADLVLIAMGFSGPGQNDYVKELEIELDARGFIRRDENNMTSASGVFTAGDMTQGASLVVRAIADGMQCAEGVQKYFEQKSA